jgi:protease secretion system membrane fusion protein
MAAQLPLRNEMENEIYSDPNSGDHADGMEKLRIETRRSIRRGYQTFGLGLGGLLLFAALVPLNAGVTAPGTVTISTKRKPVQHLIGGIIVGVFVKEGQFVKAGQALMQLDNGIAKTNFESAKAQYMTMSAMQSRLVAQQTGASEVSFAADVLASSDPSVQNQIANQRSLFQTRRVALEAEKNAIGQQILGAQAMAEGYRSQVETLQEQLSGIRELVAEGYAPRVRELDLRSQLSLARANFNRSLRSVDEARSRIIQAEQSYRTETESQLMQVRTQVEADLEKYKVAGRELERTTLRAPADGQVVGLAIQSVGAVISPGFKIMDIVPVNEALIIEAPVEAQQANRLKVGDTVDLQFSTFAKSGPITVEGKLDTLSSDVVFEGSAAAGMRQPSANAAPVTGPTYLARISVTKSGLNTLGSRQLQPGMPVSVLIKTGSRTLLTYLLRPLFSRFDTAMKEE